MTAGGKDLTSQVALVSGGSGAIGAAVMTLLQERGAKPISLDLRSPANSKQLWVRTDVTDDAAVQDAVTAVAAEHGRIDILVHAAGVSRDAVLWKLSLEDWDLVQNVNLRAAFVLLRHVVPVMRRNASGQVVLIGSINGARGKFGLTAYAASKAGLVGLAKSAARETARLGIRVNVVEPGMVDTPMIEHLDAKIKEAAVSETLLGRLAVPADVAEAVVFLCGPSARHVTGQVLRVDGGQYL